MTITMFFVNYCSISLFNDTLRTKFCCASIWVIWASFIHRKRLRIRTLSDLSPSRQANELLQGSRQIQNKLEKERTLKESLRLYQQISHHTDLPLVCSQYRQGECRGSRRTEPFTCFYRYITPWSHSVLVQCASMREWWSSVSRPPIRRTLRSWGCTSTGTASRRRTPAVSRPSRSGQYTHTLSEVLMRESSCNSCVCPGSAVLNASRTPCRSWWTRAKPPLSLPASPNNPDPPSWPLTPTCWAMRTLPLMWVTNHPLGPHILQSEPVRCCYL